MPAPCLSRLPCHPERAWQAGLSSRPSSSPTDANSLLGSTGNETRIIAADTSTATATIFPESREILQVSAQGQSGAAHLLHLPLQRLLVTTT